jgi:hypothetical protein
MRRAIFVSNTRGQVHPYVCGRSAKPHGPPQGVRALRCLVVRGTSPGDPVCGTWWSGETMEASSGQGRCVVTSAGSTFSVGTDRRSCRVRGMTKPRRELPDGATTASHSHLSHHGSGGCRTPAAGVSAENLRGESAPISDPCLPGSRFPGLEPGTRKSGYLLARAASWLLRPKALRVVSSTAASCSTSHVCGTVRRSCRSQAGRSIFPPSSC